MDFILSILEDLFGNKVILFLIMVGIHFILGFVLIFMKNNILFEDNMFWEKVKFVVAFIFSSVYSFVFCVIVNRFIMTFSNMRILKYASHLGLFGFMLYSLFNILIQEDPEDFHKNSFPAIIAINIVAFILFLIIEFALK